MVDRNAAETVNVETQSHQRVWIRLVFKRSRHRRLCSRMLGQGDEQMIRDGEFLARIARDLLAKTEQLQDQP